MLAGAHLQENTGGPGERQPLLWGGGGYWLRAQLWLHVLALPPVVEATSPSLAVLLWELGVTVRLRGLTNGHV